MNRREVLKSAGAAAMIPALLSTQSNAAELPPETVYELRVYHMNEGKLPLILDRFRSKETAIFARCGMHGIAYWTPTEPPLEGQTLIYMLRHTSREAARASWAKFVADPEWIALKAETERDGEFVKKVDSTFLKLTDFSPQI